MLIDIKVPTPGESITQVICSKKIVENGAIIEKDTEIAEIDSDKATLSIISEQGGKINFLFEEGDTIPVGAIIATVDTDFSSPDLHTETLKNTEIILTDTKETSSPKTKLEATPLAHQMMTAEEILPQDVEQFIHHKKITKKNVTDYLTQKAEFETDNISLERSQERIKLSPLRQKLAQRLVSVKNETAMLTTFNEIDMTFAIDIKSKFNEKFKQKHGVSLGFMSLFTKATSIALREFSMVNSQIDGDEIVSFNYTDIAIAVSAPKGLLVPVIRNVEKQSISEIEINIKNYATKARDGKLSLEEMQGGTFTITNGGVFGSLMSTPIINPPQSAILGMHNIQDRPIALNGQVVIRPMMYIALSYDHRIIDGRESVGFLKRIKELIENPLQLLTEGKNPIEKLLNL